MTKLANPYLQALKVMLLILIFPILSGTIITLLELESPLSIWIQFLAFVLAGIYGFFRRPKRGQVVGLAKPKVKSWTKLLYLLPVLIAEGLALAFGLKPGMDLTFILATICLHVAVGFAEEFYFRGWLADILQVKGYLTMVFFASFVFAIGHLANLLGGADLFITIYQIVFAFIFGLVAMNLALLTKSLWIPIIWHACHNILSQLTPEDFSSKAQLLALAQGTILLIYGIYLAKLYLSTKMIKES